MRNKILYIFLGFAVLSASVFLSSCTDKKAKENSIQKHTCPMHPQIIKEGPGTCPICGMDLVPVNSKGTSKEIILSESQVQLANIKTAMVSSGDFKSSKVLNGRLLNNPELTEVVSSRYAGRIEKLYIKETGRPVSVGQALFEIYSEELQTLQQDYLLQVKQAAAFPDEQIYKTLREGAKSKLRLFGYSNAQISALNNGAKVSPNVTVFAKVSGIVNELSVNEGQYVSEGSPIMRLENFNQLWVEADVYPAEVSQVRIGSLLKVSVNGLNAQEQTVKINYISPQIDPASQLLKVRAVIQNPGNFQPGMQATVLLPASRIKAAMSLPLEAVMRDAKGAHVWIQTAKNTFEPRMVTTGEEDETQIIITSGLENVKEVVISGTYLLSSEFILKKGSDPTVGHNTMKHD
ncbi:efflux RND transporter periplasmic adaptor subunit [Daejeonella oryzae]|uniref:efflux RND transporter periplasmic adaptor subunit n=1 Tax=Daejeonella oryzae TaxID=1122943 RepID=UPI0005659E31|nr:efflux RND transporter periplasmic adaptor subunit [Daejeonella oryzae]